jgi:hypothetical protein
MTIHPQSHLSLGQSLLYIAVVAMQGDPAVPVGRTGQESPGELALKLIRCIEPAFGLAQHVKRNGRLKLLLKQPLMRGGVLEFDKALVGLLELQRCLRQSALVVIDAPLDIAMGLQEVHVTVALGAHNGLVVNTQAVTDRFKLT